ncbi:hypothetical protein BIY24_02680 [Halobacteriovorax marinus]|nr:hypothetical protein BIY24_02680 [Halobacteriovorax marinus]
MKRLIFSFIFISTLVLIFFIYQSAQRNEIEAKTATESLLVEESSSKDLGEKNIDLISPPHTDDECEKFIKTLSTSEYENIQNRRWSNVHIKYIDGETYRIRYFYDDGPNGEYQKTILYKEDETEFPHIVKVFKGFEQTELKDYFDRGDIIWQEQAYETSIRGKSIYWRKINDEFVDLNIDEGLSCL